MNIFAYLLDKMLRLLKLKVIPIGDLPPNSAEIIERAIQNLMRWRKKLFFKCSKKIPKKYKQAEVLFNEFIGLAQKGQNGKIMMAQMKNEFNKIQKLDEEIERLKELKIKSNK